MFTFICSFFPRDWNWRINLLAFFSIEMRILWLIVASTLIYPKTRSILYKKIEAAGQWLYKKVNAIYKIISIVILSAICWVFPVSFFQLGDGSGTFDGLKATVEKVKEQNDNTFLSITDTVLAHHSYSRQPFVAPVHAFLFVLLKVYETENVLLLFSVLGIIALISSLLFLFFFIQKFEWSLFEKVVLVFFILFNASSIFFFGYIESYTIVYVTMLVYVFCSWLALEGKINFAFVGISFVILVGFHLASLILLPGFVFVMLKAFSKNKKLSTITIVYSVAIILVLLLNANVIFDRPQGDSQTHQSNFFLPLFHSSYENSAYQIVSWEHLVDLLNEFLLVSPFSLVIVFSYVLIFRKSLDRKNPVFQYLTLTTVSGIGFLCIANFELGFARDWDIASVFLTPFVCYALHCLKECKIFQRETFVTIIGVSFLYSILWVSVNAHEDKSLQRFYTFESTTFMNDKMRGYFYDQLGQYYSRKNQWDSVMFYSEKSLTLLPRNTSIWNRLEKSYDTLGALEQNIALYNHREIEFRKKLVESRERTKSGVDEVFIYLSEELGYKYYETKDYNNAILFWEKSFEDGKGSFNTLKDLGSVFLMTKQFENALNAYDLYNQNMNIPTVTDSSTLLLEKLASHLIWLKENGYDSTVIEQEYHKYVIEQK